MNTASSKVLLYVLRVGLKHVK